MDFNIIRATKEHLPHITGLLEALYTELGEERASLSFLTETLIGQMTDSGQTVIYLAMDQEEAVGLMTLTESQAIYAGGKFGIIDEMYVLPSFRSSAIGQAMIDLAKGIGMEKGWKRIDVTAPTDKRWQRTVDFYRKNGFEHTGPKLKLQLDAGSNQ